MRPLLFRHTFSNGLQVTLRVTRDIMGRAVMRTDKANFQTPELMEEYLAWTQEIAVTVWEESTREERNLDFLEGLERACGNI